MMISPPRGGLLFVFLAVVLQRIPIAAPASIWDNNASLVLPIFIKLHKVASSTVASLFNCVNVHHKRAAYGDMMKYWEHCTTHHTPWSHNTIGDLELFGLRYFSYCGTGSATITPITSHRPLKLITVLRRPRDRFISAIRYFDQIRKRKAEVRRVMVHPSTVSIAYFRNLTRDIFTEDQAVKPEVRLHEYVDIFASLAHEATSKEKLATTSTNSPSRSS